MYENASIMLCRLSSTNAWHSGLAERCQIFLDWLVTHSIHLTSTAESSD